jgi:hypothetical protein
MSENSPKAEAKRTAHSLTPRGEWFDEIHENDIVGVKYFSEDRTRELTLDFSFFDDELDDLFSADLESDFDKAKSHIERILNERGASIDHRTFFICVRIFRKIAEIFKFKSDADITKIETERENKYKAMPTGLKLSELTDAAMCTEYAFLAQHCLQNIGIKSALVNGSVMDGAETRAFYAHSYIVINPGEEDCYVFDVSDPVRVIQKQTNEEILFPRLLTPSDTISLERFRQFDSFLGGLIKCQEILFGDSKLFGATNEELAYSDGQMPEIIGGEEN